MAKHVTAAELRKKDGPELVKLLAARREHLRHLRFQHATRSIKNFREMNDVRREIARIVTIMAGKTV